MKTYTVANFGAVASEEIYGQSFVPSDGGPDGDGDTDGSLVMLVSFSIGYEQYGLAARATQCFVYSQPLSDPTQVGTMDCLLAVSQTYIDECNVLGPNSFSRRFTFDSESSSVIGSTLQCYVYFNLPQIVLVIDGGVYGSGALIDYDGDLDNDLTAQFMAELQDADQ